MFLFQSVEFNFVGRMQRLLLQPANFRRQLIFLLIRRAATRRLRSNLRTNRLEFRLKAPNLAANCKQFLWVRSCIVAISLPGLATMRQLVRHVITKHWIGEIWNNVRIFERHQTAQSSSLRSSRLCIVLPEVWFCPGTVR